MRVISLSVLVDSSARMQILLPGAMMRKERKSGGMVNTSVLESERKLNVMGIGSFSRTMK